MNLLVTNRAFGRFWATGLFFQLAWWSLHAVMLIHVFELTRSPFATGLIPVFAAIPGIVLGPIAGVLVDRWSRQRTMARSALLLAGLMLVAIPLAPSAGTPALYGIIFLQAAAMTFFSPAENALLPALVPLGDLTSANSLNALNDSLGRIVGPAIGAWLLVEFGFAAALGVGGLLYLAGWTMIAGLRHVEVRRLATPAHQARSGTMWTSFVDGFRSVRTSHALTLLVLVSALYMVADVPLSAVLPAFMQDSVGVSARTFGTLMSVRGLTGLIGGLVVVALSRKVTASWLLIVGLFGYGASILTMGVANSVLMSILVLAPIGLTSAAYQTGLLTLLQTNSAPAMRGRMFALIGTINGFITIVASIAAGGMGELAGTRAVVIASGILHALPLVVAIVLFWNYRAAAQATPVPE